MLNWQTTQFLQREELRQELNEIEKVQGVKIEQIVILERWQEDPSANAYYLALYRLADLSDAGVLADEADQQERDALQVRISENVPDTMTTRPYDYELRDRRLRQMSERERR